MSGNPTPRNPGVLIALASDILAGQVSHGVEVGLVHHTATTMQAALWKVTGNPAADPGSPENMGSQLVFLTDKAATKAARLALKIMSDGPVKTMLEGYRKVLQGILGKPASVDWEAAGFLHGTTAVPTNAEGRYNLLVKARAYMALHPAYETSLPQPSGPALDISAANIELLRVAMNAASQLINDCGAAQAAALIQRDLDIAALFQEVSGTITELGGLLAADDPRWELFGLNIPAHPSVPLGINSLNTEPAGTGNRLLTWSYARRSTYTQVLLMVEGVDTDFRIVADPHDLEHTLMNLSPGSICHVRVVPMNGAGAGPASPIVTFTA